MWKHNSSMPRHAQRTERGRRIMTRLVFLVSFLSCWIVSTFIPNVIQMQGVQGATTGVTPQAPLLFSMEFTDIISRDTFVNITKGIASTDPKRVGGQLEGVLPAKVRDSRSDPTLPLPDNSTVKLGQSEGIDWRLNLNLTSTPTPYVAIFHFITPLGGGSVNPTLNFVGVSLRMKNEIDFRKRSLKNLEKLYNIVSWHIVPSSMPSPTTNYTSLQQQPVPSITIPLPANAKKYANGGNDPLISDDQNAVFAISLTFLTDFYYTLPPLNNKSSKTSSSSSANGNSSTGLTLTPWFVVGPDANDYQQRLSVMLFGDPRALELYRADLSSARPMPAGSISLTTAMAKATKTAALSSAHYGGSVLPAFLLANENNDDYYVANQDGGKDTLALGSGEQNDTTTTTTTTTTAATTTSAATTTATTTAATATSAATTTTTIFATTTTTTASSSSTATTTPTTATATTNTPRPTTTSSPSTSSLAVLGYLPTATATIVFLSDSNALAKRNQQGGSSSPSLNPTLQQLYTLISTQSSLNNIISNLPGCVNVSVFAPGGGEQPGFIEYPLPYSAIANRYTPEERREQGHDSYMKSKVGFLVAIIVIFVVSVIVGISGHFYSLKAQRDRIVNDNINAQFYAMRNTSTK